MADDDIKQKVKALMEKSSKAFVLATVDERMRPRARYMGAYFMEGDFTIYMATYSNARKVKDILRNPAAQLLFAAQDFSEITAISGKASIEDSVAKKKEVWNAIPSAKDYFPGPTAPEYGVIKFKAERIEYTDQSKSHEPVVVEV